MIIVLNKADFSQNNIGKITLPEETYQLLPITTEVLSRFTTQFSITQQKAVDTFFRQLSNAGILSKIKVLLLPLLAANINEACMNVLDGELAVTGKDSLTLTSRKGIKPIVGKPLAHLNNDKEEILHIATYVNSIGSYVENSGTKQTQFALSNSTYLSMGKNATNSNTQPAVQISTKKLVFDINYANNNSSMIASYSKSEGKLLGSVGGEVKNLQFSETFDAKVVFYVGQYTGGSYNDETNNFAAMKSEQSIIALGDYVDESQHLAYNLALETLNSAFN